METPDEKDKAKAKAAEGAVESPATTTNQDPDSHTTTDQDPNSQPVPVVRRKGFKGKGDSLNSMAERDRARHDPANGSLASRIANMRRP